MSTSSAVPTPAVSSSPAVPSAATVQSRVRRHYEALPYPLRNPENERTQLLATGLDDLALLNHYGFAGRKDFTRPTRILVAGGGTGDSLVYLAHQLRKSPCELVYIDLSAASLSVAQQRIRVRQLQDKVFWIQGSLTDIDQYGLGAFDVINCSGVLHHLPDPVAGLKALRAVLKPDGVLALMVYGQYGRTGVYQLQDLLRRLNSDTDDESLKLDRTRRVLETLPPTNWYQRGHEIFTPLAQADDHEVYDLLLHSQDRAYTVPQLYEFLETAGLQLVEFTAENRLWYDPSLAFRDPEVLDRVLQLPRSEQQALCEVFWGTINKHLFWASPRTDSIADPRDPEMVPVFTQMGRYLDLPASYLTTSGEKWTHEFVRMGCRMQLSLSVDPTTRRFLELIDRRRSLGDIVATIHREQRGREDRIWDEIVEIQRLLRAHDLLALRHRSLPPTPEA